MSADNAIEELASAIQDSIVNDHSVPRNIRANVDKSLSEYDLNKDQMIKKHGEKQVHIWRRSFDTPPPPMKTSNPYHPTKNKNYANIPLDSIPASESLKNTFDRVVPYYKKEIEPLVS